VGFDRSRSYCGTGGLEGSLGADDLTLRSSDLFLQLDLLMVSLLLDIISLAYQLTFVHFLTLYDLLKPSFCGVFLRDLNGGHAACATAPYSF